MQVASAANGTNDGDGGSCLVAGDRRILVVTARCGGYSGGPRPFSGPRVPLSVFTLG